MRLCAVGVVLIIWYGHGRTGPIGHDALGEGREGGEIRGEEEIECVGRGGAAWMRRGQWYKIKVQRGGEG